MTYLSFEEQKERKKRLFARLKCHVCGKKGVAGIRKRRVPVCSEHIDADLHEIGYYKSD